MYKDETQLENTHWRTETDNRCHIPVAVAVLLDGVSRRNRSVRVRKKLTVFIDLRLLKPTSNCYQLTIEKRLEHQVGFCNPSVHWEQIDIAEADSRWLVKKHIREDVETWCWPTLTELSDSVLAVPLYSSHIRPRRSVSVHVLYHHRRSIRHQCIRSILLLLLSKSIDKMSESYESIDSRVEWIIWNERVLFINIILVSINLCFYTWWVYLGKKVITTEGDIPLWKSFISLSSSQMHLSNANKVETKNSLMWAENNWLDNQKWIAIKMGSNLQPNICPMECNIQFNSSFSGVYNMSSSTVKLSLI